MAKQKENGPSGPGVNRRRFIRRAGEAAGMAAMAAGGLISAREFLLRREKSFRAKWSSAEWLMDDPMMLKPYARDFGNLLHEIPLAAVYPESVKDVPEVIAYGNEHGIPLICRGVGHACNGQSLLGGGIILDFKPRLNQIRMAGAVAELEPGITWLDAQNFAISHGRGFAVLPDFLGITVGGNLSLGGLGTRTLHFQSQSDHVRELEVVTGKGELVRCSRKESPELFRYTLWGLGQLAVITRAWMDTIPYRPRSLIANLFITSYSKYIQMLHRLTTEDEPLPYDFLYGFRPEGAFTYLIRIGKDDLDDARAMETFKKWVSSLHDQVRFQPVLDYELYDHSWTETLPRTTPEHYHVWVDFLPPPDLFLELAQNLYEEIAARYTELDKFLGVYQVGVDLESARDFPLACIPRGRGRRGMSINLYFTIPPGQEKFVEQAKQLIAGLGDRYFPKGCKMYPYGWYRLSAHQRREMWGQALEDFIPLKKSTDPHRVINPFGVINSLIV